MENKLKFIFSDPLLKKALFKFKGWLYFEKKKKLIEVDYTKSEIELNKILKMG